MSICGLIFLLAELIGISGFRFEIFFSGFAAFLVFFVEDGLHGGGDIAEFLRSEGLAGGGFADGASFTGEGAEAGILA